MGQSEGTVVELNGTSRNGSRLHRSMPVFDWTQEAQLLWLPAEGPSRVAVDKSSASGADPERLRLEAEIAAAKARAVAAREHTARRDAEIREALQAELAASREQLTSMEREHDAIVARVREAARLEVDRILAEARRQAAARPATTDNSEPTEPNNAAERTGSSDVA